MGSLTYLKAENRRLQDEYKKLKSLPRSAEADQERATAAIRLRHHEIKMLIYKAAMWGVEPPKERDWYLAETNSELKIVTPDLNDSAVAMIQHRIRNARLEYWKGWAQMLIPILSLLIAILALLIKR
jgi:hypothetical protein